MSDTPQGPGWWQASDDKWYPPPRPQMPGDESPTEVVEQPPPTAVQPFAGPPPVAGAPPAAAPGPASSGGFPAGPPTASGQGFIPPGAPGGPPGGPGGPPSMPGTQPSPYGGVPMGQPGMAQQQNRTPLFIVLGVLVAAGLVGLIMLLTSGGDNDDPPGTTTTEQASPTTAGPATTAVTPSTVDTGGGGGGGGGGTGSASDIEVVESGFSVFTDELSEEQRFSYGFVVKNNSDSVATSVPITVAFLDDAGTVTGTRDNYVWVLMPGQSMGLGEDSYEDATNLAEIQVTVGEPSTWESPEGYGEITADGITTSVDEYGAPTTAFTATSTYAEQVEPYSYVIYRNAAGEIVGGGYSTMSFVPANGSSAGSITSYSSIPDIDNGKTEVFFDPGYIS